MPVQGTARTGKSFTEGATETTALEAKDYHLLRTKRVMCVMGTNIYKEHARHADWIGRCCVVDLGQ